MLSTRSTTAWYLLPADRTAAHSDLLSIIGAAKKALLVRMYALTEPAVIAAIEAAQSRGVPDVRVLLDAYELSSPAMLAIAQKLAATVTTRSVSSPVSHALMHEKTAVIDHMTVLGGSTNWTTAGILEEVNTLTVTRSRALAAAVTASFETLWVAGKLITPPSAAPAS